MKVITRYTEGDANVMQKHDTTTPLSRIKAVLKHLTRGRVSFLTDRNTVKKKTNHFFSDQTQAVADLKPLPLISQWITLKLSQLQLTVEKH